MSRTSIFPSSLILLAAVFATAASPAAAAGLPCSPCAGVRLSSTEGLDEALGAQAGLEPGSPLFVAWEAALDGSADSGLAARAAQAGATPWLVLVFRTPAPLPQNLDRLQGELNQAARLAAAAPDGAFFQVLWRPEGAETAPQELSAYAFLLKRAAVALTGARTSAQVATQPLTAGRGSIAGLYAQDVAAYVDALAVAPGDAAAIEASAAALQEADPGRPLVIDSLPLPAVPAEAVAEAARQAVRGASLTLFRAPAPSPAVLAPFALLAREFSGDISYDPYSSPTGAAEAWSFVRGKDLALRVIALVPEGAPALTLRFADSSLRRPTRFPFSAGQVAPPSGQVLADGLEIQLADPGRVAVLGLERLTAEEREGVAEKVTVAGERQMPVEEILRRLQAFEDAQGRRLDNYRATNTTHLRFQVGATSQSFEATLQGPFFFARGGETDWAWETLFVNGVRWRAKTIPEIPLVQPEKAAALPLEITFNTRYRYRLRGSEEIDGRQAWVIDFAPAAGEDATAAKLHRGTVWVDKALYTRLRTRAVQLGLEGEVLSNEETLHYRPIDVSGNAAAWEAAGRFVLPLRIVAQQILSVVNSATVVERETLLTDVRINAADFAEQRQRVAQSDVTMVRDTAVGLRYLVKEEGKEERVVKEGFDSSKLFLAGGVFYDDALDYPLPLAGLNYFDFDFRGTGKQLNVFFGGALLTADAAEPRLFGSRFDAGVDVFAIAIALADTLYREGEEVTEEEIEARPASLGFKLGHPLGDFVKLNLDVDVLSSTYGTTDNTADDFVLPEDNLLTSAELSARFARSGYRANLAASYSRRSEWDFWGRPGSTDFDPDHQDFLRWSAVVSKSWHFPPFQKIGLEVDYSGGSDLDRFSKYGFGFFGSTRVHGYQSNRVRATRALAAHASYGFELGEAFRLELLGDAAWATDEDTGLDNEFLGGVGINGTLIGPWQTIINLDLGVPVAGPDDGFVAYVVFLKLFK
ncbi:MAG TPA: hypothetical protein VEG34_15385 [Thermoanaerobaculia bacterium]|nr:hypothetical protein [Thermoanaerobaculia bacterium]